MLEQLSIEFIAFTIIGIGGVACLFFWNALKKGVSSMLTGNIAALPVAPTKPKPIPHTNAMDYSNSMNTAIDDAPFYEQAIKECDSDKQNRNLATWAKAFSMAEGNDAKTKAKYIELRVNELTQKEITRQKKAINHGCPNGHGRLQMWEGQPRCWTCGWTINSK